MNQILDIVAYLQIFIQTHWTSSGNCRDELVVLIGGDDWSSVNWQGILISDWSQVCDNWNLRPPRLFKDGFSTRSQMASGTTVPPNLGLSHPPYQFDVQMFLCVERLQSLLGTPRSWGVCVDCGSFKETECQLTLDQSSLPISTTNSSLQLPDKVQWVWMKICK